MSIAKLSDELAFVLERGALQPLFQPIVDVGAQAIHGYEALIRGPLDSSLHAPLDLIDVARRAGRLAELDRLCRRRAIERFAELELPGCLFLNVMPSVIVAHDPCATDTCALLAETGLSPERVVIELTEGEPIDDYGPVQALVAHYRAAGFKVALDDLGAGYASLRHWAELRPDFVKLDRHFIAGIDASLHKREFLRSILDTARSLDCQLIAEGVETDAEHRALWEIDRSVRLLQGYYFCVPTARPPLQLDLESSAGLAVPCQVPRTAGVLARGVQPMRRSGSVDDLVQRFRQQPDLHCVPVVDGRTPVGLVRQHDFLSLFTNPYSHALYRHRSVGSFVQTSSICVPASMPLEALSRQLTDGNVAQQDFLVTDERGAYLGVGSILDLLREMTTIRVREARHANPLTGLPGNLLINDTLDTVLAQNSDCLIAYCDVDHFKAFNDAYGYEAGDQLILMLAELLQDTVAGVGEFLGHVGGDDFLFILRGSAALARCKDVLQRFAERVETLYAPAARAAGGLYAMDRQGVRRFFPLASLSIAALPLTAGHQRGRLNITASLSELKREAKRLPGNSLFVERRRAS